MKTIQKHLCQIKKHTNSNKHIKPLMYKVHLLFLQLKPFLMYCGYSTLYFLKFTNKEKSIRVYVDTRYYKICKVFLLNCSKAKGTNKIIKNLNIKKKDNYLNIYTNDLKSIGLYKLFVFFYYKNGEEKIEGIYVLKIKKNKKLTTTTCTKKNTNNSENSNTENDNSENNNYDSINNFDQKKCYYFRFKNDKKKRTINFDFTDIKFEHANCYTYINTFCECFYLPLIFPCLLYNIHKVKFKLSVSFRINSDTLTVQNVSNIAKTDANRLGLYHLIKYNNTNSKNIKLLLHIYEKQFQGKVINKIGKCKINKLSSLNKKVFYNKNKYNNQYTQSKKYIINCLTPSNLVVSNSKLKKVYYSTCKGTTKFLFCNKIYNKCNKCNERNKCNEYNKHKNERCFSQLRLVPTETNVKKSTKLEKNNNTLKKNNKTNEFITYKFYGTDKIANYSFCLFVGIYDKIYFKIKNISFYIYLEQYKNDQAKKIKYDFFINIIKKIIILIFKRLKVLKKKIYESKFLQFMVVNMYKYAGEENYNCITLLMSFVRSLIEIDSGVTSSINNNITGENKNNELTSWFKVIQAIKLIIHEMFHIVWGNCLLFKKEKYLWCKEGLTRYYEIKYSPLILKKLKCIKWSRYILSLWLLLEYYFYVIIIDTLNEYNHILNIKYVNIKKKYICNRNYYHFYDTKDIHYFYNTLTYNKGMNIFKIINIISKPYFDNIMDLIYFTFYNCSINMDKILTLIHFFFIKLQIKQSITRYKINKKKVKQLKHMIKKKKRTWYISKNIKMFKKVHKKKKLQQKLQKHLYIYMLNYIPKYKYKNQYKTVNCKTNTGLHPYTCILLPYTCSNFFKLTFKKYFVIYYKIHKRKLAINKGMNRNKNGKQSNVIKMLPLQNCANESKFIQLHVRHTMKQIKMIQMEKNIFKSILNNYLNVVGAPKLFLKFIKTKAKLQITQKHFYYDNYNQKLKKTNILFQIPFIFTLNSKTYKILLTKKNTMIDIDNEKKYLRSKKTKNIKRGQQNIFQISIKNSCYFSYHFVNISSFKCVLNSIENNDTKIDVFYIIINIIMNFLVCVKSLKHAQYLIRLISEQLFMVYKLLKNISNTTDEAYMIGMILCIEFFQCYIHFSSYFENIENMNLKIEIRKEVIKSQQMGEVNKQIEFLLKDFRIFLSKIFFFFKESINSLL
ncbi:M1-family alanyl aminopeptidase, putative [Hepatocystis sp. ex Piliocolobus tephrosceles]|nr:M1-family alanyl aminopeptidase, putative [Hepatocystis sp. ex Piliocolobus tephrosceles]